jgi:hypothetical protein
MFNIGHFQTHYNYYFLINFIIFHSRSKHKKWTKSEPKLKSEIFNTALAKPHRSNPRAGARPAGARSFALAVKTTDESDESSVFTARHFVRQFLADCQPDRSRTMS